MEKQLILNQIYQSWNLHGINPMNTQTHIQPAQGYLVMSPDMDEPAVWEGSGENLPSQPVLFLTHKEAEKEIADTMQELYRQVLTGERSLDEVPQEDYILPAQRHADGTLTTEHHTWTQADLNQMR